MSSIHRAVWSFGAFRTRQIALQIQDQLRSRPAIAIYEGEVMQSHRTLWDEYCHEIQNGPHDLAGANEGWEQIIHSICDELVAKLPTEEKRLLFFAIDSDRWPMDFDEDTDVEAPIDDDEIRHLVAQELAQMAGDEDLSRFDEEE